MFRSTRARAVLRGAIITIPVVVFFALLLAGADPLFATWRDEIARIISAWSFIPRAIFFCVLLVVVLGAYSFAARAPIRSGSSASAGAGPDSRNRWLGATERLILVSAVAALFWLFIAVQLSYLFGNAPALPGSGVTFAEYARRGFTELTIVATCSVVLILVSERYGRLNGHAIRLRALTISLLIAVLIILASAFHRVSLYEAAYGYTIPRLYAQVYMLVLATALLALAWGVTRTLNTGLYFRSVMAVAVVAFAILVFWNHEAWIASANIDRYSTTGKLDVVYLTRDLSPNAIPVVVSRLKTLPEPMQGQLHEAVVARYGSGRRLHPDRWFEWNLRRQRARTALASIGLPLATGAPAVVRTPE
jgi:two-component system sensor histidine kinase BaeS